VVHFRSIRSRVELIWHDARGSEGERRRLRVEAGDKERFSKRRKRQDM
jgi:hypothetical protein